MFCSKCGNELREGAKFCSKCGAPVRKTTGGTESGTGIPVVPAKAPEVNIPPAKAPEVNIPPAKVPEVNIATIKEPEPEVIGSQEQKPGMSGVKLSGIVVLILAVMALLAFGGYMLFFRGAGAKGNRGSEKDATEVVVDTESETADRDGKTDEETGESAKTDNETSPDEKTEPDTGKKSDVSITVRQVDNTRFPEMTLYASITDQDGNPPDPLESADLVIKEIGEDGNVNDVSLKEVYRVSTQDKINVNLVLDAGSSMDGYGKMQQVKNAANALIGQMNLENGDQVEVISFNSFVYLEQAFSSQRDVLRNAIAGIDTSGEAALYDALYAGLLRTYYETGAKCVIGFTDGVENAGSYTFEDVAVLAKNTGIPVFIIGIGEEYDAAVLQNLADQCSGKYYSANVSDPEEILEDICFRIYQEQQDCYVVKYMADDSGDFTRFRNVVVETSDSAGYAGHGEKQYVPLADISGIFSESYMNQDQILDFSGQRAVTEGDLTGLSLAELRIARNEIFARHGRHFKDSMLNQWFYSKAWYLNLPVKYLPDDFDHLNPNPLSTLEQNNAAFILEYEKMIISSRHIFPDAGAVPLTEYDLALSKDVLRTALEQMNAYPSTGILEENKRLVQEKINQEDVQY